MGRGAEGVCLTRATRAINSCRPPRLREAGVVAGRHSRLMVVGGPSVIRQGGHRTADMAVDRTTSLTG